MKRFALVSAVAMAAGLAGPSMVSADIMLGTAGNGWQAMPGTLNNYSNANRPFWDNPSRDVANPSVGGPENIANYLKGPFTTTISGTVQSPGITPNWWGNTGAASANFDLNPYFNRGNSSGAITATLLVESTLNANTNVVGWYDADNPTNKTVLWSGPSSPTNNATVTFTPTTNWGFYLLTTSGIYYMDTALSSLNKTTPHFAVFQSDATPGAETYYVGCEDLASGLAPPEGLGDFNDFIFKFSSTPGGGSTPTPEPASLAILGAGAAALLMRRKR